MPVPFRLRLPFLMLLASLSCVLGCSSRSDLASGQSSTTAGRSGTIAQTKYAFHQWENSQWAHKLKFMVWVDFNYDETTTERDATIKTVASHWDGRRIEWQLAVTDGNFTKLRINDSDYDPTKGTLFLVSTNGGTIQIRQLRAPLPEPGVELETCEAFAKSDPDVAKFIAATAKPK